MLGTDKYAYASKLKNINPMPKLLIAFLSVMVCLFANSIIVSIATILIMSAVTIRNGGIQHFSYIKLVTIPISFILIGILTIMINIYPEATLGVYGVDLFGKTIGITLESTIDGAHIFFKAIGCITSIYFAVLTTPLTDITWALSKLGIPKLFIELMELIYRFVFVLTDTANKMKTAQTARLGYMGLKRSYDSMGSLVSMVFLRAYKKSDKVYTALESRGYTGELNTLSKEYEDGNHYYKLAIIVTMIQLVVYIIERGLIK